ncbi:MAG: hypothetical protein JJU12_06535 [Chlamydiales bacterium]|nr:hypothetical protein [Chlamydiales bacterium]
MIMPVGLYQNQKLSNALLISGIALIITGIALTCINHQAAFALGNVSLSLGTPILLIGSVMKIFQKCSDDQRQTQTLSMVQGGSGQIGQGQKDPYGVANRRQ